MRLLVSLFPTPQRPEAEAAMMRHQTNLVHLALTKALLYPTWSAVVLICSLGKLMIGGDERHIIGAGYYYVYYRVIHSSLAF